MILIAKSTHHQNIFLYSNFRHRRSFFILSHIDVLSKHQSNDTAIITNECFHFFLNLKISEIKKNPEIFSINGMTVGEGSVPEFFLQCNKRQ